MNFYLGEMNQILEKAAYCEHELKDFGEAERLYRKALNYPNPRSSYYLARFLLARGGDTLEASAHLQEALDSGLPAAAVLNTMNYIAIHGLPIKDSSVLSSVSVAASKGHLFAQQTLIEHEMTPDKTLQELFQLFLQRRRLIKQIKRRKKENHLLMDDFWY